MTIRYRQHVFLENGTFSFARVPFGGGYFDAILVGGGASGYYINRNLIYGGVGGQVVYKRMYVTEPRSFLVTIGNGGASRGPGTNGPNNAIGVNAGAPTSISDVGTASGGADAGIGSSVGPGGALTLTFTLPGDPGILITNGLFANNTTYYGGGGGGYNQVIETSFSGGIGGGGSTGGGGGANTGGGGGAGLRLELLRDSFPTGAGGSGIVIIRYPIVV
jgi:hypothetical protein